MPNFGDYTGEQFFKLKLEKRKFLIENILKEKDSMILVGDEKSGKSLFIFQLICSLTSQCPFLDEYDVLKPCKVTYIQLEGELEDSQDRFNRMIKSLDFDNNLFQIIYSKPVNLSNPLEMQDIKERILRFHKPDVVIIDPIYFAFPGDLSDNVAVRAFTGRIREFKDSIDCAILLVHHTHKIRLDKIGRIIKEGDEAIFGSKFFKAWADSIFLLVYDKIKNIRILKCQTQRSGDILSTIALKLIEPAPLYFEKTEKNPSKTGIIMNLLGKAEHKDGLNPDSIMKFTNLKRNTFYNSIKEPLATGQLEKIGGKPVIYKMRGL